MKKTLIKILVPVLSVSLLAAGVSNAAYALTGDDKDVKSEVTETVKSLVAEESKDEPVKDETVYVIAGQDGSVKKIIVSDWLKNTMGQESLNDKSELTGIEPVKDGYSYTMGGDNTKVWDTAGHDVYYQGNIDKELPVAMKISYTLDGNPITAEELKGKSGKVTIRFDYENRQYENRQINGTEEKIYVPFAMLTGMLLDNDTFSNIEVTNGKLINDGSRTAVIGIAFPGLQEDLGIEDGKLDLEGYFEITADVNEYEPAMTVTVATNEIFNRLNGDKLDDLGGLGDSVDALADAVNQLTDGSSKLYDGLCTLLDKSGALVNGIDALAAGAEQLKNGSEALDAGAGKVAEGAAQLSSGLNTLKANNDTLNGGAKQVFDTLLATADSQLAASGLNVPELTIDNYAEVLNGVIASLDEDHVYAQAEAAVRAAVEEKRDYIEAQVTEAVRTQVEEGVKAAVKAQVEAQVTEAVKAQGQLTEEQMNSEQVKAMIDSKTEEQMGSAQVKALIETNTENKMASDEIKATIAENVEAQIEKAVSENMGSDEVKAKLKQAGEGVAKIQGFKTSLDSYNEFYTGLKTYTAGVAQAADGAGQLKSGSADLKKGADDLNTGCNQLYAGILTIKDGMPALTDGITKLKDGAMQLSDGMKQFNEEGIQKLVEAVDGDLEGLTERLKAVSEVSKNYRSFSGIDDEMDGNVKFIYKTEE